MQQKQNNDMHIINNISNNILNNSSNTSSNSVSSNSSNSTNFRALTMTEVKEELKREEEILNELYKHYSEQLRRLVVCLFLLFVIFKNITL